ncbi:hypothetical protein C7957_102138 [Halanaerobium saccharolyticum]|uniref:Uncharacterized protein n=1 Tax=Halanaerobium saccharolyticum TaxID=43595 RepID=A0A4R6SLL7_9FIRM|nr:hypothetical protein C7957_102138 [Halanaerobium saccharolyticum]
MDIAHVADVINEKSKDYKVGNLQYLNPELKFIIIILNRNLINLMI